MWMLLFPYQTQVEPQQCRLPISLEQNTAKVLSKTDISTSGPAEYFRIKNTKTKVGLSELFEKVQLYMISKNLKEIRDISSRPFFKGPLSLDSVREFDARYKIGWADKFEKSNLSIDKYLNSLG